MIVADAWYTSITALTLYGAAAGILGTVAVVWATFRVANPHRRLLYGMPTATPLLNRQAGKFGGLVIRRDEQTLTNLYVVEIVVTSRSRSDITRADFVAGPLVLDVTAPIIEVLQTATQPEDRALPDLVIEDSLVRIGPSLIGKRQTISAYLPVDGPPALTCHPNPFANVDLRSQGGGASGELSLGWVLGGTIGATMVSLLLLALLSADSIAKPVALVVMTASAAATGMAVTQTTWKLRR